MNIYNIYDQQFGIKECEDLEDNRVRIKYILDGTEGEDIVSDRSSLGNFFAKLLKLDKNNPWDTNYISILCNVDSIVSPLDLPELTPEQIEASIIA